MNKNKNLGQVFTPEYIVKIILNNVEYFGKEIIDKKILEPSFGDGAFLCEIVERLLKICKQNIFDENQIINILNKNIHGIEIDEDLYNITKNRLNELLNKYGLPNISWTSLKLGDALKYEDESNFDYIVGNPPYVRIHNLDEEIREYVKKFKFSSGTIDMYVLFFEKSIGLLNKNGRLGFITPNSFMRNTSQGNFRKYLIENSLIEKIFDFKSHMVFHDALTYTAITILNKNRIDHSFIYSEWIDDNFSDFVDISFKDINKGDYKKPWSFSSQENNSFIKEVLNRKIKLKDICNVQYGICTNRENIFINEVDAAESDIIMFNNAKIEKGILKKIIKGSTYNKSGNKMILFPYEWDNKNNRYIVLEEDFLKHNYPLAYDYLLKNKEELDKRDMDKDAVWYQFARSQGLTNNNYKKIVVNHMFDVKKEKLNVYELNDDILVYAGIYITVKDNNNFQKIKDILQSKEFCKYCKIVGKDMQGGWKSINTKIIKDYGIELF